MKKSYQLEDLECAHCAAKMEDAIKKLDGVKDVTVSFMTQKMILETEPDNQSKLVSEIAKLIKKIEPDCNIVL